MNIRPQFIDISSFQSTAIDWNAYVAWSKQVDGKSRVSLRSSQGVGFADSNYPAFLSGFRKAGGNIVIHYHYAYPEFNTPQFEADYQKSVIGNIPLGDIIMLDYEEDVPQAAAEWALTWLEQQQKSYPNNLVVIYSYTSFIESHLQDIRMAKWPLIYANWQFDPNETPACPLPWLSYWGLQYTDGQTNIPGVPFPVDADVYLEMKTQVDYQTQAAYVIWNAFLKSVNTKTGIFALWLADYKAGKNHGPALTNELPYTNWSGQKGVVQVFPGGQYEWISGVGKWYQYT